MSSYPYWLNRPRQREKRMSRTEEVNRRTNGDCGYCSKRLKAHERTRDHIIPRSKGGKTTTDNLMCACRECNQRKASLDLEDFRDLYFEGGPFWFEILEGKAA